MATKTTSRNLSEAELNSPDLDDDGEIDVESYPVPSGDGIEDAGLRASWDEAKKMIDSGEESGDISLDDPDTRPDSDYDKDALETGTLTELEHTDDEAAAKKIAKDHLDEDRNYYTKGK